MVLYLLGSKNPDMNMTKMLSISLAVLIIILVGGLMYFLKINPQPFFEKTFAYPIYLVRSANFAPSQSAKPNEPEPFPTNLPRTVKPTDAYTIILVGDSMTDFLGENPTKFREYLKSHYCDEHCTPKGKVFGIFNLGFGSTNVLSLQDRIEKESFYLGKQFQSILNREFDLIIIESFGNNPLSQYPLEEGLKKQDEALDKAVRTIHKAKPNAVIAFMTTVAPIRNRYAEGSTVLSPEVRRQWADERAAYIKNHAKFAQEHNIPLLDLYTKTLNNGEGTIDYINSNDFIHPSVSGIDFISKEMADWIYNERILPL
jgi:lysophospholipase L1-like esterase